MKFLKYTISLLAIVLCVAGAYAGQIMVTSALDSTTMLMGSKCAYKIEVVQDKGTQGEFPLFKNLGQQGYVTVLNDTVEISAASSPDTVEVGSNRIQINYDMLIQVFDSGYYKIPGIPYVSNGDTVWTKEHYLKITPVKVTAEDKISPMTSCQEPEGKSIFDILPDWLYYWWWLYLLIIALIVIACLVIKKYRKTGSILPQKPETPPHIVALDRLNRLKARHLWESGHEREYYTLLTDILRIYLYKRFGIKAMEMTSKEIMETLAEDKNLISGEQMMKQILDVADFVKFAKVRPLPDDNVKAFDNAVKFIEDTAPRPEPEEKEKDAESDLDRGNISGRGGER